VSARPSNALVWFAVLGGGLAWVVQFVAGLAFTFAQCDQLGQRTMVPVRSWQAALAIAGTVVGLASTAVAVRLYRVSAVGEIPGHVRHGDDARPPVGRIQFLAVIGLVVNFLAVAIMVMTAIGAPLLRVCQQS
jgi:hypothetical protein